MDRREYFIAIAEELNISKAAQRIYVSQQSLSMYLKKLEEFYKVELIVRKPKLMLTPAGKALLETYKKMERIERNLVTEINEIVSGAKGSITVGIHSARSTLLLPEAIEMFLHEYPSISFNIIDGHVSQFEQDLQNGKIDIFIGVKPTNNKNFASELLIHEKMLLAISDNLIREYFGDDVESFKEQFAEGIDIKECAKLPFIMQNDSSRVSQHLRGFTEANNIEIKTAIKSNNGDFRLNMAKRDIGAAICTQLRIMTVNQLNQYEQKGSHLNLFPINGFENACDSYLVYDKNAYLPVYLRYFIDLLIKHYRECID